MRKPFVVLTSFIVLMSVQITASPVLAIHTVSRTAIQPPVLKWQDGGCYNSWCETGWYSSPAVADLDGDGAPEVIGSPYTIFVLDGATGKLKWHMPSGYDRRQPNADSVGRTWPGIGIADLDGNGDLEIITAHSGGYVSVYDHNGYFEPGWPQQPTGNELRGMSIYDLDQDGDMEIVVTAAIGSHDQYLGVRAYRRPAPWLASARRRERLCLGRLQ